MNTASASKSQDKRADNGKKIIQTIYEHGPISRQEIARNLGLSLPTVFNNIREMMELGFVEENGEFASTGGRKAKQLSIKSDVKYSIGIDLTKHHLRFLIFDLCGKAHSNLSIRCNFSDKPQYYMHLIETLHKFIHDEGISEDKIVGVGLSVPGIVNTENLVMLRSHILGVSNIDFRQALYNISFPICIDNDANCSAYAEVAYKNNVVYLSLSYSVGGAIYISGKLHAGEHLHSGEFGHIVIHPNGKRCYCGKRGCFDAYCSVDALLHNKEETLDVFFQQLENGDRESCLKWDAYLENLALFISNIRNAFDCDIVLGGYIGNYIEKYMNTLVEKIMPYNTFDQNISYVSVGHYQQNCAAMGAAKMAAARYITSGDIR